MRSVTCAVFASLILVAARATAAPFPVSAASSSITRVENIIDPLLVPYQQSSISDCGSEDCIIKFPTTAHDNTLILHASCTFVAASNAVVVAAALSNAANDDINSLSVTKFPAFGAVFPYSINAETYLFFARGQKPQIEVIVTNVPLEGLHCTVSGYNT
jgi:hypothetical protein